jgi:hypothetical protein
MTGSRAVAGRTNRTVNTATPMNTLKIFCRTIIQMVKQACLLPKTIANAVKQRQRQTALNELEVERLDRIRNPSKYLGK